MPAGKNDESAYVARTPGVPTTPGLFCSALSETYSLGWMPSIDGTWENQIELPVELW